jgi:histidyl-tRNA synthetase
MTDYQLMAAELRAAGIRAEVYVGGGGMKAQLKYADKRRSPVVVIEGQDELARGEVTIKDLVAGARLSDAIVDNVEWREGQRAQISLPRTELVARVKSMLESQRKKD